MKKTRVFGTSQILIFGLLLLVACNRSTNETDHITIEKGSFTDPRDGNTYKTVKIGYQWIMAENLAFKPDTGNYWAYNDNDSNIAIYGYLYDWETAMNVAPDGWHLPSGDEWEALEKSLGAHATWPSSSWPDKQMMYPKLIVGGSSGLNMLLGGWRTCNGYFIDLGDKARFWTSTGSRREKTIYGLDRISDFAKNKAPYVFDNSQFSGSCSGFSVRLFKD